LLRTAKKGIRALGIAESFRKEVGSRAILAGVVMRSDLLVDGVALTYCTVGGMDSTDALIAMWDNLRREDINIVFLGGSVISWFNIVDLPRLHQSIKTPLVCITYRESKGLRDVLIRRFPEDWETRLRVHDMNGERVEVGLRTGYRLYVRCFGVEVEDAVKALNRFTLSGRYPEPVRVAKLVARSALNYLQPVVNHRAGADDVGGKAV
jgi:endonuclease V-like protein UPF0215 family